MNSLYGVNSEKYREIISSKPKKTDSFEDLMKKIAKLAYESKNNVLYFRGQSSDHKNTYGNSTFYPSIYRDYQEAIELRSKFELLNNCSEKLIEIASEFNVNGLEDIIRREYIRWSILQHYEVCGTPLLDFTHSLQVACSFAIKSIGDIGYIYVFALPYLSNRITMNSEEDMVIIRLLSISPPEAYRPFFQEGYLAGTTDITDKYDKKIELDFNNRLIGKFSFENTEEFWGTNYNKLDSNILYPPNDIFENICDKIKTDIDLLYFKGDSAEFIEIWKKFERFMSKELDYYGRSTKVNIDNLSKKYKLSKENSMVLDELRIFRNSLVHENKIYEKIEIRKKIQSLEGIMKEIKKN